MGCDASAQDTAEDAKSAAETTLTDDSSIDEVRVDPVATDALTAIDTADGGTSAGEADSAKADTSDVTPVETSPAPGLLFPGQLAMAGPLRLIIKALHSEKVGCDWNEDGSPDNRLGKIIGLYGAMNDAIAASESALAFAWLPEIAIPSATVGAKFDVSQHAASVCADGALVLASGQTQSGAKGLAPTLVAAGERTAKGFRLIKLPGFGSAAWTWAVSIAGVADELKVDVIALRVDVQETDGGFEGMLCAALQLPKSVVWNPNKPDPAPWRVPPSGILSPDLDLDGDSSPESVSIALDIKLSGGKVIGVAPTLCAP